MAPQPGHCAHCGAEDTGDDSWVEFPDITIAPGHRGPRSSSVVTTVITGYVVCAQCLVSPWGQALRDILTAPWAAPVSSSRDCTVVCTGRGRRRRLVAHHFKHETATCPVCYRDAAVEYTELEDRPTIWDRLATRAARAAERKAAQVAEDAGDLWREWTTYGPPQAPGERTPGDDRPTTTRMGKQGLVAGIRRALTPDPDRRQMDNGPRHQLAAGEAPRSLDAAAEGPAGHHGRPADPDASPGPGAGPDPAGSTYGAAGRGPGHVQSPAGPPNTDEVMSAPDVCPDCGHDHETLECADCPGGYCVRSPQRVRRTR